MTSATESPDVVLERLRVQMPVATAPFDSAISRTGLVIVDEVNGFATVGMGPLAPPAPNPQVDRMIAETDRLARSFAERDLPIAAFLDSHVPAQIHVVKTRVEHEEAVRIPERVDERARDIGNDVDGDSFLYVGRQAREEMPAQCVGANGVEHVVRIDDIAQRLGHLLAVFVDDMAQADAILVGNAVRDECCDCVQ